MNNEYQDALDYRADIESGEINKGGFILGSKYLALLAYMEMKIDNLMFEFCPEEMTEEQIKNWDKYQAKAMDNFNEVKDE